MAHIAIEFICIGRFSKLSAGRQNAAEEKGQGCRPVELGTHPITLVLFLHPKGAGACTCVLQVEDIRTGGNVFRLRQMTMHAPGEHKYGSTIPRLEVQFMHEQGFNLGAISIPFVDGGPSSKFLQASPRQFDGMEDGRMESLIHFVDRFWYPKVHRPRLP